MEETAFYQGPGFRFHPTDEEIVRYYLKKKLTGNLPSCFDYLAVIDIYKFEPWDLPSMLSSSLWFHGFLQNFNLMIFVFIIFFVCFVFRVVEAEDKGFGMVLLHCAGQKVW